MQSRTVGQASVAAVPAKQPGLRCSAVALHRPRLLLRRRVRAADSASQNGASTRLEGSQGTDPPPQPPSSSPAPAFASRDSTGRGVKRLQQHARRELLSRAWAVVAGGAADVARFRGRRSITPPAHQAAREAVAAASAAAAGGGNGASGGPLWSKEAIEGAWGRLLYRYYLWRQNTLNDLQLIMGVSTALLLLGAWVRHALLGPGAAEADAAAGGGGAGGAVVAAAAAAGAAGGVAAEAVGWWRDLYQVLVTSFGESFPSEDADPAIQMFAIMVSVFGLAAFALVLALVEQVVLEANNRNVKRGSRVYETGHYLILGWCISQRDLEMVMKVVQQLCLAYRHDGGTAIVILSQREKLELEEMFRRAVPMRERYGSRLVFRQGSPLVPADLQLVSASSAGATVIVSDQSRSPAEADAQVVRCAILLDELDGYVGLRRGIDMGHVVAEIQTRNALPLLHYSCSPRVVALPTGQLNARRLSKMVKRPFISWVSQRMFNFENQSSNYVQAFPELIGCSFGELAFRFPDGSVYGVAHTDRGVVDLNPPTDYVLTEADQLVICRPTNVAVNDYKPLPSTLSVRELEELAATTAGAAGNQHHGLLHGLGLFRGGGAGSAEPDERAAALAGSPGSSSSSSSSSSGSSSTSGSRDGSSGSGRGGALFPVGVDGARQADAPLWPTLLDVSPRASIEFDAYPPYEPSPRQPNGASLFMANGFEQQQQPWQQQWQPDQPPHQLDQPDQQQRHLVAAEAAVASSEVPNSEDLLSAAAAAAALTGNPQQWADAAGASGAISFDGGDGGSWVTGGGGAGAAEAWDGGGARLGLLAEWGRKLVPGVETAAASPPRMRSTMAFIPTEYVEHDDRPEKVLIAGWAGNGYMADILQELDAGTACLPQGSEVLFVNDHVRSATLGQVVINMSLQNVKVSHVKMDPLQQAQMARIDLSSFKCAIVLCDEHWIDPDHDESNGIESTDEPSMLRLDALMMTVQLNIRRCLADDGLPPINIICQKVATAGLTRFEDRHRLPLGISVNFTSFAAKMLAIVAYNPIGLLVYAQLGECADLTFVDAEEYADVGEVVSYWELLSRAQLQGDLLLGWYRIPDRMDEPIESVFNPQGLEVRGRKRVWNEGDGGLKFIIIRDKECIVLAQEAAPGAAGRLFGSEERLRSGAFSAAARAAVQQRIGGSMGAGGVTVR